MKWAYWPGGPSVSEIFEMRKAHLDALSPGELLQEGVRWLETYIANRPTPVEPVEK